nr:MAG TPA: ssDNA binding protein [Caudoviricetes sp.]
MIKITNKSQEFTSLEVYNMTKSHKLNTLKNVENGAKLEVVGFMEWEHIDEETGETTQLMSLLTTDGTAYVTQSDTFKRDFFDIVEIFEHNFPITVEHGVDKSKAGRDYHYCAV